MPRIKGRRLVHGRKILWAPVRAYLWYALALAMLLLVGFASNAAAKSARGTVAPEATGETTAKPPAPGPARFFTINEILQKRDNAPLGSGGRTAAVEERAVSDATAGDHRVKPGDRNGQGPEPFGMFSFRAPDGLLWTKWRGLETELAEEAMEIADCRDKKICGEAAARYLAILDETKSRSGRARIETANRLVNGSLRYVSDQQHHGVADRWQAPLAALGAGRGDCEEYAIAKYMLLRATGFAESDLRLVLVRDTAIRVDHAVLAARFEGRWLVLDNRKSAAVEAEDLRHYMPLYALGAEGVKLFAAPFALRAGDPPSESDSGERPARNTSNDRAGHSRVLDALIGAIVGDPREATEDAEFSGWALRGGDFAGWTLRGSDLEPAATEF
jgi:predicted transglutaminase-like cysteine proteinase